VLVAMCNNLPAAQIACIQIISVIPLISSMGKLPSWSQELSDHQEEICSVAKRSFLRQASAGTVNLFDGEEEPPLTFEAIASASLTLPRLWSCLIEAIGKFTVGCPSGAPLLSRVRSLCFKKLGFFDIADQMALKSSTFLIWKNLLTLLLSLSGTLEPTKELAGIHSTMTSFQPKLWDRLVEDSGDLIDALVSQCCQTHYQLVPVLVTTLLQWWRLVHDNPKMPEKRKGSLFFDFIALLRSITDADNFGKALELNADLAWYFVPLFEQLPGAFALKELDPATS
jgi:hypothetical protein